MYLYWKILTKNKKLEITDVKYLKSNLPEQVDRVLDSHLFENKLFISFESREIDNCKILEYLRLTLVNR